MKSHFLAFLLLNIALVLPTNAQDITGKITDGKGSVIAYANVVLLSKTDSTFIAGTTSDTNGVFSLEQSGTDGLLRISAIGYKTRFLPCQAQTNPIILQTSTAALGQVTVKGHRKQYSITADGLQTNVEGTVLSKMGTADDVLKHVPSVTKTKDGYEVFGKGSPLIYINGRKVQDTNELKQLNSSDIKYVEVLRNPGASYDASVNAVIRIKTKKAQGEGFGFDTRSTYILDKYSNTTQQINLKYYHNGINLFGSYFYNNGKGTQYADNTVAIQSDTVWSLGGGMSYRSRSEDHKITGGFSYDFAPTHSLGVRYDISFNGYGSGDGAYTNHVLANGKLYDHILSHNSFKSENKNPTHQLNIYYNGVLGKTTIDFNTDLYFSHNGERQFSLEESEESVSRTVSSLSRNKNRMVALKLVIGQPLWGGTVTAGAEYIRTNRHDTYEITGTPLVSNAYTQLKEQTISPFAEYTHALPLGNIKAGVRYERVLFDYYNQGTHIPEQSRNFSNLFPSISLGTHIGKTMMQLSYTVKTNRPQYSQLTNEITYANRFTMQTGNPLLKHETDHCVEVSGVWKFIQFSANYKNNHNAIIYWISTNPLNEAITIVNYKNLNSLKNMSAYISAAPKIGIWSPQFTIGMYKQWLTLETQWGNVKLDNPVIFSQIHNTLSFNKGWMLDAQLFFQSQGNRQTQEMRTSTTVLNIGVTKSLLHDALTLEIKGTDLLYQQYQYKTLLYTPKVQLGQFARYNTRGINFTLRYKFNSSRNKYKGTGAGTEEINRL